VTEQIADWLSGRTQGVKINGEYSEAGNINSREPQENVLVPCL
jgi:hypothetical protein